MEDINEKILWEGYGLRFRGGTRTRTGLVCRTDQGIRELKKPRGGGDSLRLAFQVKERLWQNGFRNISRMYQTVEGEPFYRYDGVLYMLEDPMPAEALPEEEGTAFICGADLLGQMHKGARGLQTKPEEWDRERLPGLYAKRRGELAKMRRRNDRSGSYDAIGLLLLQYYEEYMERAEEAEDLLRKGNYGDALEDAAVRGAFCHNAYKGEALRQNRDGRVYVGNFDKCSRELPLADVAFYLRRYMKKTEGEEAGVWGMLESYGRHCPLSEGDLTVLQGMLVYPEKFLRLVNEYNNRRRSCVSPAMGERLAAAAREEEKGMELKRIIAKGC